MTGEVWVSPAGIRVCHSSSITYSPCLTDYVPSRRQGAYDEWWGWEGDFTEGWTEPCQGHTPNSKEKKQ